MSAMKIKLVPIEEEQEQEEERGLRLGDFAAMTAAVGVALGLFCLIWKKIVK